MKLKRTFASFWTGSGVTVAALGVTFVFATEVAIAQTCPLQIAAGHDLSGPLMGKQVLASKEPAAVSFRSKVDRDDDGAPDAYHRGLPGGGPDPGLDHICAGGSVMEYRDGRLYDKYATGGSVGQLQGHSPECKRDYIQIRDAGFPACAPGQLCMLWYGLASEPRHCG
jgi:hypothetical protein